MKPQQFTPEQLRDRLSNPLDHLANRVNEAMGTSDTLMADDWSKARAYEDLVLFAIQLALQEDRSHSQEIIREIALALLSLARQSIKEPIASADKGLPQ